MIDFKINSDSRIRSVTFCHAETGICIPNILVNSISTYVRIKPDLDCPGDIIENYRRGVTTEITATQKEKMKERIQHLSPRLQCSSPYLFCFSTSKSEINELIRYFKESVVKNSPIDLSKAFLKNTNTDSITKKVLSDSIDPDYIFDVDIIKNEIDNIYIIDDALNNGRTLNQLLVHLAINKKINNKTKIHIVTIYSFLKSSKKSNCNC